MKNNNSMCVEKVFKKLGMPYEKVHNDPDAYVSGCALDNIEGVTLIFQCMQEYQIQMHVIVAEQVEENKVEALMKVLAKINLDIRFFSIYLDDDNSIILSYTYHMLQSMQESVDQIIALMDCVMTAIDEFISDINDCLEGGKQ